MRRFRFVGLLLFAVCSVCSLVRAAAYERTADGVVLRLPAYALKLQVCAPGIIRVVAAPDEKFFAHTSLMLAPPAAGTPSASAPSTSAAQLSASAQPAESPQPAHPTAWELIPVPAAPSAPADATPAGLILKTSRLQARVDLTTGQIVFLDAAGKTILAERASGRSFTPAEVVGEKVLHVRQQWDSPADESLYGLGQTQELALDLKGRDLDFWQRNTEVFVPFLVSSRGYGILWDNNSRTRFGDLRDAAPPPAEHLFDAEGKPGGLTATYYADAHFGQAVATRVESRIAHAGPAATRDTNANEALHPALPRGDVGVRWEGFIETAESGVHTFQTYSDGGAKLWIDGVPVIDHWRQNWLPGDEFARVSLEAGKRHRIRLEWTKDQGARRFRFLWKTPSTDDATSLWSEAADGLDYYFVHGPSLDDVIAGYRQLTGAATLMPRWSFGLWQSRQRYETSKQLIDAVKGFRDRKIPFDVIVQDWFYWPKDAWGSHAFDPERFPDPDAMIRTVHDDFHARLMISVWGKFYPGTKNFDAMNAQGFLYQPNLDEKLKDWIGYPYTFYDALNPAARRLFWSQIDAPLFRRGVDAWWLDATEPDLLPTPDLEQTKRNLRTNADGSRIRDLNAYALVQSQAVYEGQRGSAPDQRVFILTRAGFAGQQRYAAATWSGDVTSTWTAFKKQIAAGLGFSISGVPYWTMDIGGFSVPSRFGKKNDLRPEDVEEWREMNTRWFQFGAFTPVLRVHGEFPNREMWEFGGENHPAYAAMLKADRLRYRLLPYLYSVAGHVTHGAGTFMRPLVMDFTADAAARGVIDQYLFGPVFLVSPVTTHQARERSLYLPADALWYDFWTGRSQAGGKTIVAPAPYDEMPLHVRAGSIIPFGPELQHTAEKPSDPITLYVYTGADGSFTLYEDDGLTFAYEKGASARIPFRWDEASAALTIGARVGAFPGMLAERTFAIVFVTPEKPSGFSFDRSPDQTVSYRGAAVTVRPSISKTK